MSDGELYKLGFNAGMAGGVIGQCPYGQFDSRSRDWCCGFSDGQREREYREAQKRRKDEYDAKKRRRVIAD